MKIWIRTNSIYTTLDASDEKDQDNVQMEKTRVLEMGDKMAFPTGKTVTQQEGAINRGIPKSHKMLPLRVEAVKNWQECDNIETNRRYTYHID